jgi:hypothetical protein
VLCLSEGVKIRIYPQGRKRDKDERHKGHIEGKKLEIHGTGQSCRTGPEHTFSSSKSDREKNRVSALKSDERAGRLHAGLFGKVPV